MARFVYIGEDTGELNIALEADDGEDVPPDMVLAWAQLHQAYQLKEIDATLSSVAEALNRLAESNM